MHTTQRRDDEAGPGDVLAEIYRTQSVTDGVKSIPLHSHISQEDGRFIQDVVTSTRATRTLEIGMAYGLSTLFICQALRDVSKDGHHIAIDPFQLSDWAGIGVRNVALAGFESMIEFLEARSEFALPRLLAEGRQVDVALIDGWHSFDQALLEFYYVNRMVRVGGAVIFDDADWPSINSALRYIVSYPSYEVIRPQPALRPSVLGRVRRHLVRIPLVERSLRSSLRRPAWDLGLDRRCVALRKIAEDQREMTWFADF